MSFVLEIKNIEKSFGNTHTLNNITLGLESNEVLALLGDNGAGKSTLIKIMAGILKPDAGKLFIRGQQVDLKKYNVQKARQMGVETVFQENALGKKQFLWRNIFMGRHLTNSFGFINVEREKIETRRILKDYLGLNGAGMDENALVKNLSGGEKQGIAIGRALYFESDILILDEPTTALSVKEVRKVMAFISQIRQRGKSCILITHNIGHAYNAADKFVLLERGRIEGVYGKDEFSLKDLTEKLVEIAS